jgi:hypothetical protein
VAGAGDLDAGRAARGGGGGWFASSRWVALLETVVFLGACLATHVTQSTKWVSDLGCNCWSQSNAISMIHIIFILFFNDVERICFF